MATRVAINGLGRIGRLCLRAWLEQEHHDIDLVAVNHPVSVEHGLHLIRYDSVHGLLPPSIEASVEQQGGLSFLKLGAQRVRYFSTRSVEQLDWSDVDVVLECTGKLSKGEAARAHLERGAGRVLVSAPSSGADASIVYGVNHESLHDSHRVVSCASCTTNAAAPLAAFLDEAFGLESGFVTTIHAYTGDQSLVDSNHQDWRRGRAGALSMIPTKTGAASAIGEVLPALKGKLDGAAIRVPVANVSLIDLSFRARAKLSVESINAAAHAAAARMPTGVMSVNEAPLVSCDFNHTSASAVFDATQTRVAGADSSTETGRVVAWYDNEWGFATRMLDLARLLGALPPP